jgi:SAM-dependent methyltransferase
MEVTDAEAPRAEPRPGLCYCGASVVPLVASTFYGRGPDGRRVDVETVLYHCRTCDLVVRDLDYNSDFALTHYDMTSYTQPETADDQRQTREPFFRWLYGLAVEQLGRGPESVLDFGCAHGHLLDLCAAGGASTTVGVEIAPQLVETLRRAGRHRVFASATDPGIPDASFDVVMAIDSIYLVEGDPQRLLSSLAAKVRPGGVMVIRTTNRNQIYRLLAATWHARGGRRGVPAPVRYRIVGDAKFGFSERALARRLSPAGFEPVAAHRWERRRRTPPRLATDLGALALHRLSRGRIDLCPGLVTVARRTAAAGDPISATAGQAPST